ncbi:hypothetical protein T484DRAFT_1853625 [Baffinella frigidus]|nr:hypothetical protein T484DRAFT_1853625 [Cryptophyta sp. CCMP2293]
MVADPEKSSGQGSSLSFTRSTKILGGDRIVHKFQFVYVPCDSHSAMEEWNLIPKNKDDHIGCLTDRLQLWYAKAGGLTGEKRAHFLEHLKFQAKQKNLGEDAQEKLSGDDPFIDDLVSQESVEIVTLLPPMPESGYISVCMYVDDKGMARRLTILLLVRVNVT